MSIVGNDGLFNGVQVSPIVFAVTLPPGTYKKGMLLGKVGLLHNLIGEATFTPETVNAGLSEDVVLKSEGEASAYFEGEFDLKKLITKEGTEVSDVIDHARKLRIFIG